MHNSTVHLDVVRQFRQRTPKVSHIINQNVVSTRYNLTLKFWSRNQPLHGICTCVVDACRLDDFQIHLGTTNHRTDSR